MMLRVTGKLQQACPTGKEEESDVPPAVGQELYTAAALRSPGSRINCDIALARYCGNPLATALRACDVPTASNANPVFGTIPSERHFDFAMQQEQLRVLLIEDDEGFARAVSGMLDQTRETPAAVVVAPSLDAGLA